MSGDVGKMSSGLPGDMSVRIDTVGNVLQCLHGLVKDAQRHPSDATTELQAADDAISKAYVPSMGAEDAAEQLAENLEQLANLIRTYLPYGEPDVEMKSEAVTHLREAAQEALNLVAAWTEPVDEKAVDLALQPTLISTVKRSKP